MIVASVAGCPSGSLVELGELVLRVGESGHFVVFVVVVVIVVVVVLIIIILYIYHALINALSAHMIHVNLNMIFYTLVFLLCPLPLVFIFVSSFSLSLSPSLPSPSLFQFIFCILSAGGM